MTEGVAARLAVVRERISAAGGDPARVCVLGVTKGFGSATVADALAAGLVDLGENYAQELQAKAAALAVHPAHPGEPQAQAQPAAVSPRWHFIGRLQRNKVASLAGLVSCWQSIDRVELAEAVAHRAPGAHVMVQVNVSGEAQKGGVAPSLAAELVERCRGVGLLVDGLMAVAATGGAARAGFARLHRLADDLDLPERSMGMSADLEAAVAEGTTMIRVGTALFGPRLRPATRSE